MTFKLTLDLQEKACYAKYRGRVSLASLWPKQKVNGPGLKEVKQKEWFRGDQITQNFVSGEDVWKTLVVLNRSP